MGDIKGVRGVVTFYQENNPGNIDSGDIWVNPHEALNDFSIRRGISGPYYNKLYTSAAQRGLTIGGRSSPGTWVLLDSVLGTDFPFDNGSIEVLDTLRDNMGNWSGGCNSSIHWYLMGGARTTGAPANWTSDVEEGDFPWMGSSRVVTSLSQSRGNASSCNSSLRGFNIGGYDGAYAFYRNIGKIEFPFPASGTTDDLILDVGIGVSYGCNASTHGYACGGTTTNSGATIRVNQINFPFDSTTAICSGLTYARRGPTTFNSSIKGFVCGGSASGAAPRLSYEKVIFALDGAPVYDSEQMSQQKAHGSGFNSSKHGFVIGGENYSGSWYVLNDIDRITMASEGNAIEVSTLATPTFNQGCVDQTDFVKMFL